MTYATEKAAAGRRPITIVELDLDYCQNTYGQSPCSAALGVTGASYCFNTRATCQDSANYNAILPGSPTTRAHKTYRFCTPRADQPANLNAIPSLVSVSTAPTKLEIEGGLGQRASVTITLQDHTHHDRGIDKYHASRYGGGSLQANAGGDALLANLVDELQAIPVTLSVEHSGANLPGTYWGRLRARNPYYLGRVCRVLTGYLTDSGYLAANFVTRTYLLESISGPDSDGKVQIKAKDPLKLADNERAKAPVASTGRLSGDIAIDATAATLLPAGVGDDEYPASGYVRIGSEVCAYTRSGDDLTLTRGQFRSTADTHAADELVQYCLRYSDEQFPDIVEDLLLNYAGIPAAYIPTEDWDYQAANFTANYSALITEPVGVGVLLRELCESAGGLCWWDEESTYIRIRSIQQPESDDTVDEDAHIIEGSLAVRDVPELRYSQTWVYSNQRDPTESLNQQRNWLQLQVTSDLEEEGDDKFGQAAIKEVYSRWITSRASATSLAELYVNRFGDTPREIAWSMDAKDTTYKTGDVVSLSTRLIQDAAGANAPTAVQITQKVEDEAGHRFRYTGIAFDTVPTPQTGVIINITEDENNSNLLSIYTARYGAPTAATVVTFVVESQVTLGSAGVLPSSYALRTGIWPAGAVVSLENNGIIEGAGGRGGGLITVTDPDIRSAGNGGNALLAEYQITISNFGSIWGGGGGGAPRTAGGGTVLGGGGGGGRVGGVGGVSSAPNPDGDDGDEDQGGNGADGGVFGQGAAGGDPGFGGGSETGGAGGLAGYYVTGNALVTWAVTGDVRGRVA